jgi:putative toxin-antitoxin system antitoxin component (TIGR02293 family)
MTARESGKRPRGGKSANPPLAMAMQIDSGAISDKRVQSQQNDFARLVADLTSGQHQAVDAIRGGYPANLLTDAAAYLEVPLAHVRSLLRLPEATAHAQRGVSMDAATSERIWRLAQVLGMAREVFEDDDAAKSWLRSANRAFGEAAPMDYLDTEPGAIAVRQVLNAIATGGVA